MSSIQRVVSSKTLTICRYFKELGRANLKAENLSLVMGSTQTDTLMMKSSKQMRDSIMMKQGLISNSTKNRVTAQTLSFSREKYLPLHFSCISSTAIKVQSLQEISKVTPIFINTLLPILSKMYKFSRCYMTCDDAMATTVMECTQSWDPLPSTAHIGPCNSS